MKTAIFSLALLPENREINMNETTKNIIATSLHDDKEHKLFIPVNLCNAESSNKLKTTILNLVNKLFEEKDYYLASCGER